MTILLLETIHADAVALLEAYDRVVLACDDELPGDADVRAIFTRGRGQVTRALIERCPALRAVARCGVGLDNIDTQTAAARGIPVIYAPGSTTTAVAEHTLMLMLALARRLAALDAAVKADNWAIRNGYEGVELAGKTLGLVGMGAIGRRVAALAEALGMRVIYWSRASVDQHYERRELDALLREADMISLHVALADETRHLIGVRELALLKPDALLINTARGAIVDQRALAAALAEERIGGFATDVLEREPPAEEDDGFIRSDRALITPHVAAITDTTYRAMCVSTARNVLAVLRGEPPEPQSAYRR